MHDPKAHSKGGTLENTINGRADEESAGAPQHIIHPSKDITKLYGMSRPCTHIYNTILPPAWQAIKQYSVLSLAGCLFQRASERCIINVIVRFNRQRARKATGVVSSSRVKGLTRPSIVQWISSTLNFVKIMQYSWPMIPRACARPLYYILYIHIYLYA